MTIVKLDDTQEIARTLNSHHRRFGMGFYGTLIGGRYWQARVHEGHLEVHDWERWVEVPGDKIKFHDQYGRDILTS